METIVFGNFTVLEILIAAGMIIGLFYLWRALKKGLKKKKVGPHTQGKICFGCGWEGQVSTHAGRCPKCNKPLGDQKARKFQ